MRRWQAVMVPEPDESGAAAVLAAVAPRYGAHHGVAFTTAALITAVRAAKRCVVLLLLVTAPLLLQSRQPCCACWIWLEHGSWQRAY